MSVKEKLISPFSSGNQTMEYPDFELHYYQDDEPQRVEPHRHTGYEILFFLEGNVMYTHDNQKTILRPNDIVVIKPNTHHSLTPIDNNIPYRRFTWWISKERMDQLTSTEPTFDYMFSHMGNSAVFHVSTLDFLMLQSKLIRMLENANRKAFGSALQLQIDAADLSLYLNQLVHAQLEVTPASAETSLYENLTNHILAHLDEDITLEDLANKFFVSKFYISHLFKANMGISLHQYVIKKRLEVARTLMLTGTDITEASSQAGFNNYSNFYRAFTKEYGIAPKTYLEQNKLLKK